MITILHTSTMVKSAGRALAWMTLTGVVLAIAGAILPVFSTLFAQSLVGADAKGYWDIARATGVVAYLLFWLSMMMGLLMSTKITRLFSNAQTYIAIHEFTSILGLVFAAVHGVVLLGDGFINTSVAQVLIPFSMQFKSATQTFWVGLGQTGFYVLLMIVISFYVRQRISYGVWRWLHFGTFVAFMLVTVHGMLAGTDTQSAFMLGVYALTTGSVLFFTLYRVLLMNAQRT